MKLDQLVNLNIQDKKANSINSIKLEEESTVEERIIKYEKKLDAVISKVLEISGHIIALEGNNSYYQRRADAYLINLTNQIYEIQKTIDMLVAFKKSQADWSE